MLLLVRNKVKDFDQWKRVFDSQTQAGQAAGVNLVQIWRSVDDASQVFFMLEVENRARAESSMGSPESEAAGREAGVIDGEFHFLVE